jgi:23S rRNA (cytosine1962-C5)-methyltransferase
MTPHQPRTIDRSSTATMRQRSASIVIVMSAARISQKGLRRFNSGHPWIFRSDVERRPTTDAGVVAVEDYRGKPIGWALWSPASEISLRIIDREPDALIDARWWRTTIARAIERRTPVAHSANAYRLIHGEGDGLPSLVCDRYDRWLVVQLLSAGLESQRTEIIAALEELCGPAGILARNDPAVRTRERLPRETTVISGDVPREIEVVEYGVRFIAAPWDGQKTGAFLDQRENRALVGRVARGRALDCFSYHGSFALHLARGASHVTSLDISAPALERGRENARRNGLANIDFVEADAFDYLRAAERSGERYDTIVLDPPAFAKSRSAIEGALRGYKDINLRAMRLLAPGGLLFTASCSFHLSRELFHEMLEAAAADSGRQMVLREMTAQPLDHPELLTVPETGYLKGALLEATA